MSLEHEELPARACRNCDYWTPGAEPENPGHCRRDPPKIIEELVRLNGVARGYWPMTAPDEWCGEFDVR